ncbi:MAG: response regulator transcription factor [Bacteroidota bacterium]|jgi:two-component system response regulator VicR
MKPKILYVEDDESLGLLTTDQLEDAGYDLLWLKSGTEAAALKDFTSFDLVILDINLPGLNGFEIASKIRTYSESIPILFLSARSLSEDRIHGLQIGADDYMIKPFQIKELILKIQIFLKRKAIQKETDTSEVIQIGYYTLDKKNLSLISLDGTVKRMTSKEAELLNYFARHANQLIKRSQLLIDVWGNDDYFLGRSMDVFISRLRKYLATDARIKIEAIHGVGFQFICPE